MALPGEMIPLHIFEERYKTMMNECLRDEKEFGIVWLSDDGLRENGCACAIERVLERMEDGRMNLLTRGTRPFRVIERQSHLAYPAGVIEFLEDREEAVDPSCSNGRTRRTRSSSGARPTTSPNAGDLAEMDAYAMAATVDFGPDAKQGLLDLRSENARLRLVTRLFHAATERLDLIDRAQERARSNGKVRFGA